MQFFRIHKNTFCSNFR